MRALFLGSAIVMGSFLAWRIIERSSRPQVPPAALRGANVLLVTIDTLRADRLGAYGNRDHLTPVLDRLAQDGVRIEQAYAHVPMTLPSHTSILTGRYPFHHRVRNNGNFRVPADQPTLATVLGQAGYATGAFVGAFVLDSRFGLNRGFDEYDDRYGIQTSFSDFAFVERTAERVVAPAAAWIEAQRGPWFAWVHLFDPHAPYAAPSAYRAAHPADPYGAEIAYTDATLGAFFDRLRAAGRLDRTLIIVTADHGESLGEHGEPTHGLFAYNATLRVPLIFWAPAALPPRTVAGPLRHVDIAPTVLDLLGVAPPAGTDGVSARLMLGGARQDVGPSYFEALDANLTRHWAPLTGVVAGGFKYIALPIPELYDLARDPGERSNLADAARGKVQALAGVLTRVAAGAAAPGVDAASPDPETAERLRALGYVSAPATRPRDSYTAADDPKTLIAVHNALLDALNLHTGGSAEASAARLRDIVRRHPTIPVAYESLASLFLQVNRPAEALAATDQASTAHVETATLLKRRGQALQGLGRLQESIPVLAHAIALNPNDPDAYSALAQSEGALGRVPAAVDALQHAIQLAPQDASFYNNLGTVRLQSGDLDGAAEAFRQALRMYPGFAMAAHGLGVAELKRGRPDAAIGAWKRAVDANPQGFDTLYNLAMLLLDQKRADEARPYLEQFVRTAPPARYAADIERIRAILRAR